MMQALKREEIPEKLQNLITPEARLWLHLQGRVNQLDKPDDIAELIISIIGDRDPLRFDDVTGLLHMQETVRRVVNFTERRNRIHSMLLGC